MDRIAKAALLAIIGSFLISPPCALFAQDSRAISKNCQSSDAEKRLLACTEIINAKGFGSAAKLADALDSRCWAYNTKMQFDRAIIDCKNAIALRPNYFYAYNNLGTAYLGINNYQEAIAVLNKAIALRQNFSWSHINRAQAYAALGRYEDAIKDLEYVLILEPANGEVRHALQTLSTPRTSLLPPSPQSPPVPSNPGSVRAVALQNDGGTYVVPVVINDVITLKFVVDSGASHVSIPADVVSTLLRTGTIEKSDFIGRQTYVLADGTEVPSVTFRLRSLRVGDTLVTNIVAGVQGRLTRFAVNYLVNRTAEAAGFTNLHPHCLRHSCGYALADRGVDLRTIQEWLGHRSIEMTVRYTRISQRRFMDFGEVSAHANL